MFNLELCKTKAGYEATLAKPVSLDFDCLRKKYVVSADAGIILVLKVDAEEIIVHRYGKLIFKTLKDEKKIKKIATHIFETAFK